QRPVPPRLPVRPVTRPARRVPPWTAAVHSVDGRMARRHRRPDRRVAPLMAVQLLPPHEAVHGNPRWYELRRTGVTASEIPVILGLSRWDSPWSLWHRKRGLIDDDTAGESAAWGQIGRAHV